MARRIKQSDLEDAKAEGEDEAGWLITLSDMMMLLLTFFVMIFAITSPTDEDYIGMLRKIGDALGGKSLIERQAAPLDEMKKSMEKFLEDNNLVNQAQLTSDTRGIVLFAGGDMFFAPGSARLKEEVRRLLGYIAKTLKGTNYKVLVEGHTDDLPTSGQVYPTNWELSTARAAAVVRYFIEEEKLEPRRFSAVGYAQYKPRYALIPENRAKNRRVEIVILREEL